MNNIIINKKASITILLLFQILNSSFSQIETSIRLDFGMSKIKKINFDIDSATDNGFDFDFGYSGQVGLVAAVPLSKIIVIGAELNFNHIQSRDYRTITRTLQPGGVTDLTSSYIKDVSYLNLPLFLEFRIKKFRVNLAFLGALRVYNSEKFGVYNDINGEWIKKSGKRKLEIKKTDYGPRISIGYLLIDQLSINAFYFYGERDIMKKENRIDWGVRQFAIGVLYKLNK